MRLFNNADTIPAHCPTTQPPHVMRAYVEQKDGGRTDQTLAKTMASISTRDAHLKRRSPMPRPLNRLRTISVLPLGRHFTLPNAWHFNLANWVGPILFAIGLDVIHVPTSNVPRQCAETWLDECSRLDASILRQSRDVRNIFFNGFAIVFYYPLQRK